MKNAQKLVKKAVSAYHRGDFSGAERLYRKLLKSDPRNLDGHYLLGGLLLQRGDLRGASRHLEIAHSVNPRSHLVLTNLGILREREGEYSEAEVSFRAALDLSPGFAPAHINMANLLVRRRRPMEAVEHFESALQTAPDSMEALTGLGNAYRALGAPGRSVDIYRNALAANPEMPVIISNMLVMMHYDPEVTSAQLLDVARTFSERIGHRGEGASRALPQSARVRIGYLSPDLCSHPVGYFICGVLENHDPASVEVTCYATGRIEDALTQRMQAAPVTWHQAADSSDDELFRMIANDRIDILIELSGHTAGNRLQLLARRPAPVQVSWMGYFGTTGLPEVDFLIADEQVVPPGAEAGYTERVLRLPGCYLCFTPPEESIAPVRAPSLSGNPVTFGCFNHVAKFNDRVVDAWSGLLNRLPDSRLLLKGGDMTCPDVKSILFERFAARGIDPGRVVLEDGVTRIELLESYRRVDVALDPFPYNGGTTTVESLWMGVPVVTLRGDTFSARVGASILGACGCEEWIADDAGDYIERAVTLGSSRPLLEQQGKRLRERVMSTIGDCTRFTRGLEQLLLRIQRDHLNAGPVR